MSPEYPVLEILLSTYNGEQYLRTQLDSIISQLSPQEFILIRDDGSTDSTPVILQEYASNHSRVKLLELGTNVGVTQSFGCLLKASTAQYNILCDQDDIWQQSKISKTLSALRSNEQSKQGKMSVPCLVVSEMLCVNENGISLKKRFTDKHRINLAHHKFEHLLLQNIVTGAACGFNSELREIVINGIISAYIHDWWIGLCAASHGKIVIIDEPLVHYRLHQSNVVGANEVNFKRFISLINANGLSTRVNRALNIALQQAETYLEQHRSCLNIRHRTLLTEFIALRELSFFRKRLWIIRNGVGYSSMFRNIALILFLK